MKPSFTFMLSVAFALVGCGDGEDGPQIRLPSRLPAGSGWVDLLRPRHAFLTDCRTLKRLRRFLAAIGAE